MKYALKNMTVHVGNEAEIKIGSVEVEYDVAELKQFAENADMIINAIKNAVIGLTPVISREIEKAQAIQHSHRMERIEAERQAEREKQENYRERHANA